MISIRFPQPAAFLNMNDRKHWAIKAREAHAWRQASGDAAFNAKPPEQGPSTVTVVLPVPDRRRRDPHNYFATVKPIIDGLVDAGLWPDDTPEWVTTTEPRLELRRDRIVTIELTPRTTQRIQQTPQ